MTVIWGPNATLRSRLHHQQEADSKLVASKKWPEFESRPPGENVAFEVKGGVKCAVPLATVCAGMSLWDRLVRMVRADPNFRKYLIMLLSTAKIEICRPLIQDQKS